MWPLVIAGAWTGGVAWLLYRAVRQFRRYRTLRPAPRRSCACRRLR